MAWGLWNKIKNGFRKVGNFLKPYKPYIQRALKYGYNKLKQNKDKIKNIKRFKNMPVDEIFDVTDKFMKRRFNIGSDESSDDDDKIILPVFK